MTVKLMRSAGGFCVFGEHGAESEIVAFSVDGITVCHEHAMRIAQAFDQTLGTPVHERAGSAAADRLKRAREVERSDTLRRIGRGRTPGFIYYIAIDGLVKIGYTADVYERTRAYPPTSKLMAVHPGTPSLEREIHMKFRPALARGREWFHPTEALLEHVRDVVEQFGNPARLAYQFGRAG